MKRTLTFLVLTLAVSFVTAAETPLSEPVADIAHRWAIINYQVSEKERADAFKELASQAQQVAEKNPGRAEPLVWQAIVMASYAKADGGLGALGKARKARDLLLEAEKIDSHALNGSIYTSLGSLYAKVPGWPIGFGDSKKARQYLETAFQMNPDGIDANYFYADFLADHGEYAKAVEHLKLAAAAKPRPGREDADAGRQAEISALRGQLRKEHNAELAGQ